MPKSRTVLKRQRQTERRRQRNKAVRSSLKTVEKKVRAAVGSDGSADAYKAVQRELDKAATKGVIHPNRAARKKSRLAKALNKTSAG